MYSDIYYNYKYRFIQEQNLLKALTAFAILCYTASIAKLIFTLTIFKHIPNIQNSCFAGTVCSDCGRVVEGGTVVPATGHQNTEVRNNKDATCAEEGHSGDVYCTDCDALVTAGSVTPTTEHQHTEVRNAWDAVCNMAGNSGDVYCTDCNQLVKYGKLVPATGEHTFGEVDANGTHSCTVCGFQETAEQEANNDGWIWVVVAGAGVVVIGGAAVAVILIIKKKKA